MIQKEFIRNELRYRYPDLRDSMMAPEQPVGRPLLFERGAKKYGARIVVCSAEEMKTLSGSSQTEPLFLCVGAPDDAVLKQFDVCVLPPDEPASALLNFIQRLFDRLDDWTLSLRQAAETGEGIDALLSRTGGILQNPVVLLDERRHIIAQSDAFDVLQWTHDVTSDKITALSDTDGRVAAIGSRTAPDALYVTLRIGEERYMLLCVASDRPLYASDEIVLDSLAGFLRLMLSERTVRLQAKQNRRESEAAALAFRILFSEDEDHAAGIENLKKLGWSNLAEYAVLAIEPVNGDLRAAHADAICNQMETSFSGCCALSLLPVIAAIVRTEYLQNEDFLARLCTFANENRLLIGACEAYPGYAFFPDRLRQAKLALDSATKQGGVALFSDVLEQDFSSVSHSEFPDALICMRSVVALERYDRAHETNYLETAEQYVQNRFNAVKTAGALFIHRSTFLYRLERIKSQFGLDLDDNQLSLFHLLLSFQIVKNSARSK